MIIRFYHPPHELWALAIAAALLGLLIAELGPQVPVDLRPVPLAAAPRPPLREIWPPQNELLAQREVLDEMHGELRLLALEAREFQTDAEVLWNVWRGMFGMRDGFSQSLAVLASSPGLGDPSRQARFQTEIFRMYSRSRQLVGDIGSLDDALRAAEASWWSAVVEALDAPEEEAVSRIRAPAGRLRDVLSRAAARLNALDGDLRDRQEEYDDLYSRVERFYRENRPAALPLRRPWHWNYLFANLPRPAHRYDFDARYSSKLAQIERRLVTRKASPRPARPARDGSRLGRAASGGIGRPSSRP